MSKLLYSFIIPVFNRPQEIDELLQSFSKFSSIIDFEIVIVEDGSTETSKSVIEAYKQYLNISYFTKPNSGPGDSRNYGMQKAQGNYFIILDSDVLLPPNYLTEVDLFLTTNFYHCFGGPDAAHSSFSKLQKAIDFSMTSFLTTGGIRGGSEALENFQPRSFNMGLSKQAFVASKGFGKIHPGEDPDLVLRLRKLDYKTVLIKNAFVYHKRRISWSKFFKQVNKFGQVRPILNYWHPESKRLTYWLPSLFVLGTVFSVIMVVFKMSMLFLIPYVLYFLLVFVSALLSKKNAVIALMAVCAVGIQFLGYGLGYLKSSFKLLTTKKPIETIFPKLFFK